MIEAELVKGILDTIGIIYGHVKAVKANKQQCQTLYNRIVMVSQPLKGLKKIPSDQYQIGLKQFQDCLDRSLAFVKAFADQSWHKRVLKAGVNQKKFAEFNTELQEIANLLNLGMVCQQIVNQKQDKADQKKDSQEIISLQETIVYLQHRGQKSLTDLKLNQTQQNKVLLDQMKSIEDRLKSFEISDKGKGKTENLSIDKRHLISHYDLLFKAVIAEGTFGVIHKGELRGSEVAIKTIKLAGSNARGEFIREADIMSRLHNPNIVQFMGVCLEKGRESLLMEYMAKGSLFDRLAKQKKPLAPKQIKKMALNIARGLHYLHQSKMLHRDLKSANVLVNADGHAKLADFGIADAQAQSVLSIHKESDDLAWMAPEVISKRGSYSEQSDIYSYGVVLWEMLTGKQPGSNQEAILRAKTKNTLTISSDIPAEYIEVLKGCWQADPAKRLSLQDIIEKIAAYDVKENSKYDSSKVKIKLPAMAVPDNNKFNADRDKARELCKKGVDCERRGDDKDAAAFYKRSAGLGYARATCNLGMFALKGQGGTKKDQALAKTLFEEAADQDFPRAKFNLGLMFERGDGVAKNLSIAKRWYEKAEKQNYLGAKEKTEYCDELLQVETYRGNLDSSSSNFSMK